MKYLILTPDGVGSTFLQRILTIILSLGGKDVLNSHEILNGLELTDNKITRSRRAHYNQNVDQITNILKNNESKFLVSRMAKYHLDNRNHTVSEQQKLIDFIKNFYDIKLICMRKNVFEYALSWSIRNQSGHLNVYSLKQKQEVRKKQDININFFKNKLKDYKQYIDWVEEHFNNIEHIFYEDLVNDPEKYLSRYVENVEVFKNKFGLSIKEYIKLEYTLHETFLKGTLDSSDKKNIRKIAKVKKYTAELTRKGIMPAGPMPIKNTSLEEKKNIVMNYDQCIIEYKNFAKFHNWIDQSIMEFDFWNNKML
jgi:hypothetical protein